MPRFLTISPSQEEKKKPYAWENFLKGNYIALGWYHTNFSGWQLEEIYEDIKKQNFPDESSALYAHEKFYELEVGDVVAANNVNDGLFGIGLIKSDYKFKKYIHDTGSSDKKDFYSHYRDVEWVIDTYQKRKDVLREGETCWRPRGTVGMLHKVPDYIKRLLRNKEVGLEETSVGWIGDTELLGYEGKVREELKLHKWIERDRIFVRNYKQKHSDVKCCKSCDLEPKKRFGINAIDFLELHHITPLSLRKSDKNSITKESDMVLLCPNCHKLIHKMMSQNKNKIVAVNELKEKI